MSDPAVPQGYEIHTRKSSLTEPWEPIYAKAVGSSLQLAVRIRQAHCNSRGFAHGGLISALADNAMGLSVALGLNAATAPGQLPPRAPITVNLSLDFLGSGQIGQWLETVPRILKVTRTLAFVDCLVQADAKVIARANATFRIA